MPGSDPVTPRFTHTQAPDSDAGRPRITLDARWDIIRVEPQDQRTSLALLLTGKPRGAEMAVDHFMAFLRGRDMTLDRFWVARDQGHASAAVLQVEAPGKAGMLFLSPMKQSAGPSQDQQINAMGALIDHASQPEHTPGLSLLQILLDPHHKPERQAAILGGFGELACLEYMRRRTHKPSGTLVLSDGLDISCWTDERRKLFGDAILGSYQHTLDCPGLVGLREIDDIIAGHMGAGDFKPELWQVVHKGDEPCAVMLMNPLASGESMELAYLGVSPAWRGAGLGAKLMSHGLGMAWTAGAREMLLAVDEANTPALALYRSQKFSATARKVAMLRAVIKQGV